MCRRQLDKVRIQRQYLSLVAKLRIWKNLTRGGLRAAKYFARHRKIVYFSCSPTADETFIVLLGWAFFSGGGSTKIISACFPLRREE